MPTRCRRFVSAISLVLLTVAGCGQFETAGPIPYRDSERMTRDLATKPKLRDTIRKSLASLYGPDARHLVVPENSGLRGGGVFLANRIRVGDQVTPATEIDPATGKSRPIEGGYTLYRRHCLHCHGVTGAGDGPTAQMLAYPRPRDYRPGIYKFTSTNPTNAKPTRDDLRKTLVEGIHGTSMPAFEALMTPSETDQVIDYMIFLSMRGETEQFLVNEATLADDGDAENTVGLEVATEVATIVAKTWTDAETQVVNPSTRRVESVDASILRGRDLFLGTNTTGNKLECVGCHGAGGQGNGSSFSDPRIFNDVVFHLKPLDQAIANRFEANLGAHPSAGKLDPMPTAPAGKATEKDTAESTPLVQFLEANPALVSTIRKDRELWLEVPDAGFPEYLAAHKAEVETLLRKRQPLLGDPEFRTYLLAQSQLWANGSLDAWGNPLRPANIVPTENRGVFYKGGRRPLDLYWRIAKGINGAKMPAHAGLLTDDQIWDVVNFVLAAPDRPELLRSAVPAKVATVGGGH